MMLGGSGRRCVVLMNQSSRDHTLRGVRPSPGPGRGAVSSQSSRDKRRKRSLPGSTVRREGRADRAFRLTVAQALVRFLAAQYSERDGIEQRLIPGCFGIFGHGNVAGVAQALLESAQGDGTGSDLPYHLARNEQGMVHAAVGYSRMRNRLQAMACTASIGPGSTNMLTGAALATTNRIPVLLLPSDIFATRVASPVLQELEQPFGYDVSVNDAFRPLSRFFDRVWRPEQLPSALLGAMRVLTDPAETGAVTIALPQDVQAEAHDWPEELFAKRVWHIPRPVPEPAALARAADIISAARRPLLVAGGGVHYSEATEALRRFAEATGIPVADTQAGKGALLWDHPQAVGGVGSTGFPGGQRAGPRGRRRDRRRHPLQRLHHGVPHRVPAPGRPVRQHQRRGVRRGEARRRDARGRRPRAALDALADALAGYRVDEAYTAAHREHAAALEPGRRRGMRTSATSRSRRRPRCSARSTR